jgi:hypothetical protein
MPENEIHYLEITHDNRGVYGKSSEFVYLIRRGEFVYHTETCECNDETDKKIKALVEEGLDPLEILEFMEL